MVEGSSPPGRTRQKREAPWRLPVFVWAVCVSLDAGLGLLLGDAVDVAATEQDLAGIDAHDLTVGEDLAHLGHGGLVGGVVEERHHDAAIGAVVVDVGGCEALALDARNGALLDVDAPLLLLGDEDGPGAVELVDLELAALGVGPPTR